MAGSGPDQYSEWWDHYVKHVFPRIREAGPRTAASLEPWRVLNTMDEQFTWPGDEWGDRQAAEEILRTVLWEGLETPPQVLVELGAGSGRFTELVLARFPDAHVLSFDVSREFARSLRERCRLAVEAGRLETIHLDGDPACLQRSLASRDLVRGVDAVYSFDALVHVDMHTLAVYFVAAARALRPGGVFALNVADAATENGFLKLLANAPHGYDLRGGAGAVFQWVGSDQVQVVLQRLGFSVRHFDANGRDAFLRARLEDPGAAEAWIEKTGVPW